MGKLEKIGRSIWKKLGGGRRRKRSAKDKNEGDDEITTSSPSRPRTPQLVASPPPLPPQPSWTPSSSDDDELMGAISPSPPDNHNLPTTSRFGDDVVQHKSAVSRLAVLAYLKLLEQNQRDAQYRRDPSQGKQTPKQQRTASRQSDDVSGYATDDTILSSLQHIDTSRDALHDEKESLGYHSTCELSPRDEFAQLRPKLGYQHRVGAPFQSAAELSPRRSMAPRLGQSGKHRGDVDVNFNIGHLPERSVTLERLDLATSASASDPVDYFLRNSVYKTKLITTVFEAKNGGFEDVYDDVVDELDRWFVTKNMMAVAVEMHFSVPEERRNRHLECRLKEKLLAVLRDNNRRLLYMKGMGRGKTPIKLAESKTEENISKDLATNTVRGIYQRCYTRLLPYLHKETPTWHAPYWTLNTARPSMTPTPERFLFDTEPPEALATTTLVSLNVVGLSILGNQRRSCDLFV